MKEHNNPMRALAATRLVGDMLIEVYYEPNEGVAGKYTIVKTTGMPKEIKTKIKTFDTETAWSDAERYANDLLREAGLDYTHTINL